MATTYRRFQHEDRDAILGIFNHYVEHSFAAYTDVMLSEAAIDQLLAQCGDYPILVAEDDASRQLTGVAFLRPYSPHATFACAAMITYFLHPDFVGAGIGSEFLARLEAEARQRGITRLLAHVSSKNAESLDFHERRGFTRCGTLHDIGYKFGESFDVIWFEKAVPECRDDGQ